LDSSLHTLHQNYDLYIFKFWNIDANSLGTGVSCAYSAAVYFMLVNQVKLYLYLIVGFHQKWNSLVDRRHPSLWIFIRKIKDEQSNIEVSAAVAQNGNLIPGRVIPKTLKLVVATSPTSDGSDD
jgi:hypothetical protein